MKKTIISIMIMILLLDTIPIVIGNVQNPVVKTITNNPVEYWGITISIAGNLGYNNLSLAFRDILCENGWKKDHIKALADDKATYQNVVDALIWLADNSDENDKVLFHHMGHGGQLGFVLNDNSMLYSTLDQYLDNVLCDGLAIILNGCHSGSAIQYLEQEGRVILTATDADHNSIGDYFSTFCLIGFQGFADFEGNNNLWNSAEEIYDFVKDDTTAQNALIPPQISDSYPGELDLTYFNYLNWPGLLDQYAVHHGWGYINMQDPVWWAQSFVPTYPVLSAVMLHMGLAKDNPGSFNVSIKEDLYGDELCHISVEQEYFYRNTNKFYVFDLPDIAVTPGEKYWIVMKQSENSGKYGFRVADDSYSEGELVYSTNQGTNWQTFYSNDFYFITLGRPIDDPPMKPATPSGPTIGLPGISYTFTTSSTDPEGNQIYYRFDWGDGNFSDWLGPFDSGENVEATYSWKYGGNYKIRVKAKDPYCAESEWSDGFDISIINDLPDTPTISGEISGNVGVSYEYTFVTTDPDGDDVYYYTDWGDGTTSGWLGPHQSGAQVSTTHSWSEQGTYTVKVKAKDIHYAESDWGYLEVTMPKNQQISHQQSQQSTPQQMIVLRELPNNN